jgi:hypothetical protein
MGSPGGGPLGGVGALGVVEAGRGRHGRHPPPGLGQGVEEAELQPSPGPDRREQRGEVVVEVVEAGPAQLVASGHPAGEGQAVALGLVVLAVPHQHQPGPEGVVDPGVGRPGTGPGGVGGGPVDRSGAARVHGEPVGQPGRAPAGQSAAAHR